MASELIYDESNWLFPEPRKNLVHDITVGDIYQLLSYADQDDVWVKDIKRQVVEREKAIGDGIYTKKTDWLLDTVISVFR